MAICFYQTSDGQVLGASVIENSETDAVYGSLSKFTFDHDLDPDVYADLIPNMSKYKVIGGELQKDGVPVSLSGQPDPLVVAKTFWAQLNTAETFLDNAIANWSGLNQAEKQTWLANNFDTVLDIERGLLHILRWMGKKFMRDMLE